MKMNLLAEHIFIRLVHAKTRFETEANGNSDMALIRT